MLNFVALLFSLFLVIKSAEHAIKYSLKISNNLRVPKYIVGFLLVAVISALPETFISVNSAMQGTPSFGLGTLFGANVADLTLIFAVVVMFSSRALRIKSKVIENSWQYVFLITLPVIFGLNGYYSRLEGVVLILAGVGFYYNLLARERRLVTKKGGFFSWKNFSLLLISMAVLLVASDLTVKFGVQFANNINMHPVLIGMFFVGLGTTLPELLFSIKAMRNNHDELAVGDIMGMVITDSTVVVGLMALISPFSFNKKIVYVTGFFMIAASVLLLYLMSTGKSLTKKEVLALFAFYLVFVFSEFSVNGYF